MLRRLSPARSSTARVAGLKHRPEQAKPSGWRAARQHRDADLRAGGCDDLERAASPDRAAGPGRSRPRTHVRRASAWARRSGRRMDDETHERLQPLVPVAEGLGITVAQLALAWVLRDEN